MSEIELIETRRMPDGTEYRVGLRRDDDAEEPYDDGQWPILRVEYRHYDYVATAYNQAAAPYVPKFTELWERLRNRSAWERYAKIFLGSNHVHEYGPNQRTDYIYVAFDTPGWKAVVGAPDDLSEEKPLAEIQAWLEGDVWGWQTQSRYNPDENLGEHEGWETLDSCYGFYGHQWAVEAAKSELADCVMAHKVVHRYPEHEKIAPRQKEIDAVLEFLECLDDGGYRLARIFPGDERHLQSVPESRHQRVVFEHFGISYNKIEEERELMFKRLRESAEEATDK